MATGTSPKSLQSHLLPKPGWTSNAITVLALMSAVLTILVAMPPRNRTNLFAWDVLLLSGFAALVLGLVVTASSRKQFETMLDRLARRGSLTGIDGLKNHMEEMAKRWTGLLAASVAACIFVAFAAVVIAYPQEAYQRIGLCLFETAWAYVAGLRVGRLIIYGRLGWQFKAAGASIHVSPGHIDGAAGLKPIGRFWLRQALTLAIPAIFLAVWSFLIPAWPDADIRSRYRLWIHPYIGLLAFALCAEVLVFVVPMLWFHREMCKQKERLLEEADELSREIVNIQKQLAATHSPEERKGLKEDLSFKIRRFREIERMPTWPVDLSLVRKFTIVNAPLVLPLLAEVLGLHEQWIKLMEQILDQSRS